MLHFSLVSWTLSAFLLCASLFTGCDPGFQESNDDTLANKDFSSIDAVFKRYYLATPDLFQSNFLHYNTRPLTNSLMSSIVNEYSIDIANLFFLSRTYSSGGKNIKAFKRYRELISSLEDKKNINAMIEKVRPYHVIFIPGFGYKREKNTGADFSRQRALLDKYGISNELVITRELGLVEENAKRIEAYFRGRNYTKPLIIVSVSKGSLDFAEALGSGRLNGLADIHAWVNVGGIMRGTYIANRHTSFPRSLVTSTLLRTEDAPDNLAENLEHQKRSRRLKELSFPTDIKVIHFVGVLFQDHVQEYVKDRFEYLKQYGPNDGLTTLVDAINPEGIVITEFGLDHYFRDSNIDIKTLALALLAVESTAEDKK